MFSNNPGLTNLVEHEIQLVSDQPVRTKPYRMSHRQNEILRNEINRMLKLGIIEVGESDYMSPMILVEIAGKEPRPCIDYRKLNGIIRTEYFPLPNIEARVEKVSAAKFITVFDLSKGYWQIPLSKTAQRYAAFCTSFGTYRPLRMSFGLKNAPYFFSKLMAELLNGLEDFVVPYLDDIAIFSDTWESHIKHMETVLQRIKRAKVNDKTFKVNEFLSVTFSEISTISKLELNRQIKTPPSHAWYFAKCPGESFRLSSRPLRSTYSRFLSGHTRALRFSNGQKTFPECHWCSSGEASPNHILLCLGFKED
ncbi:hypothetical protein TNCV_3105301 [Trichonephila clavipes]|nr:hypothetical protein TNCV_3105301 [Trichonephila clavipes]